MSDHKHTMIGRAWRFAVVGVLTAVIHYGLLAIGVEVFGLGSTLSSSVGFVACVIFNYFMHYSWTFATGEGVRERPHGSTLVRYLVMIICGFFINMSVMHVGVSVLQWHYLPVQLLAQVAVVLWNFTLANIWVFRAEGE